MKASAQQEPRGFTPAVILKLPPLPIRAAASTLVATKVEATTLAVGDEVTSVFFPLWGR